MNGYFVPEPSTRNPRPGPSEIEKRGNCKIYTLKTLGDCLRQELPIRLSVDSATKEEDFVVYNVTMSSVTTKNAWGVSYRYSEFLAFRTKMDEQWTCQNTDCSGSCQAIRDVIAAYFPKKRPAIMSTWSGAVADRKIKFENILIHLLRCVLLPGSAMKCFHARRMLPCNLFEFLGVKHETDKRSVLQVFADNRQGYMKKSATTQSLTFLEYQSDMKKSSTAPNLSSLAPDVATVESAESSQCMVCLEGIASAVERDQLDGNSSPIKLQCKHAFHHECIFEWLLFQYRCPVCRAQVGPTAVTNYCRPKTQVQWWLGDFKENPLSPAAKQRNLFNAQ